MRSKKIVCFLCSGVVSKLFFFGFCLVLVVLGNASLSPGAIKEKMRKDKHPQPQDWTAKDQKEAEIRANKKYPFIKEVKKEDPTMRKMKLYKLGINIKDIKHDYMLLSSPLVNTYKDQFKPVRFMHSKHAAALQGNCAACHHYRPADPNKSETMPCRSCHKEPFKTDYPERLGLKAAYHLQCMGCHDKMQKGPTNCRGCHEQKPVEHKEQVELPANPSPKEVTKECLRCHQEEGKDFIKTAHWLWKGPSEYTVQRQKEVEIGKGTIALNNF